jgi:hypothetical protein
MPERNCSVEGCPKPVKARGWCSTHYRRWQRTGGVGSASTTRALHPCRVPECDKTARTLGLCGMHAHRFKKTGDPGPAGTIRTQKVCSAKDCDRIARGQGLCLMHYRRMRRSGDAEGLTLERRFFDHIAGEDERGCWIWDTPHPESGYGQFGGGNAHRWSYEFFVADIPAGLELDHLCRSRSCVNPWHLDPVPTAVNVLRGEGPAAVNARKTHCIHGHEFTPGNTYRPPGRPNTRHCRACIAIRAARARRASDS